MLSSYGNELGLLHAHIPQRSSTSFLCAQLHFCVRVLVVLVAMLPACDLKLSMCGVSTCLDTLHVPVYYTVTRRFV